jgi:hypothetical protein
MRRQHRPDGIERRLGLAFLDEADDGVDHHCGKQDTRIDPMPQEGGDDGRAPIITYSKMLWNCISAILSRPRQYFCPNPS